MTSSIKPSNIEYALISVTNKNNLEKLAKELENKSVTILASSGTCDFLNQHNIRSTEISKYTDQQEILTGRVKTLHPKIHGGILARRDNPGDLEDLKNNNINKISIVIANLYDFQSEFNKLFINNKSDLSKNINNKNNNINIIEQIDIGGPTLIRAAAKNYSDTIIITHPEDYQWLSNKFASNANITLNERLKLAQKAFKYTYKYEETITQYFDFITNSSDINSNNKNHQNILPDNILLNLNKTANLRYGENPDQVASLYQLENSDSNSDYNLIQGKELSYNNYVDIDCALNILANIQNIQNIKSNLNNNYYNCCIIKHATPCGVACSSNNPQDAYFKAFSADPISAFGGIIAFNNTIDSSLADYIISNQFSEVIIAPHITKEALCIFAHKPNLRVITFNINTINENNNRSDYLSELEFKKINNSLLIQSKFENKFSNYKQFINNTEIATRHNLDEINSNNNSLLLDLYFSWQICSYVKSNAIVLASNLQTVGIGCGQPNRVGALKIAIDLAIALNIEHAHKNKSENNINKLNNTVLASDGFFPFKDSIELAHSNGIAAIVQPGGSVKDKEVIDKANELGIIMLFTNIRRFCH